MIRMINICVFELKTPGSFPKPVTTRSRRRLEHLGFRMKADDPSDDSVVEHAAGRRTAGCTEPASYPLAIQRDESETGKDSGRLLDGRRSSLLPIVPALLCVFADFYGLSAIMPMIPFHLQDTSGLSIDEATLWFGFISSAQYGGVILGCIFWGLASDAFSPMRSVQITIAGDVVIFAASGFASTPAALLGVRVAAGFFSPLVPSVAYVFSTVATTDALRAASAHAASVLAGYGLGTASIALYEPLGFKGTGFLCASIALAALLATPLAPGGACSASRSAAGGDANEASASKAAPEGVQAALRSRTFVTQAASVGSLMFYFNGSQSFLVNDLNDRFGFSAADLSLAYLSIPLIHGCNIFLVPRLAQRYGMQLFITLGSLLNVSACALLALPAVRDSLVALLTLWALANLGFGIAVIPSQARAKFIGVHQTRHGQGQITGASKVAQASGQAAAPTLAAELLVYFGPSAPWLMFAGVQAGVLLLYLALGVSLRHEPDWASLKLPSDVADEDGITLGEQGGGQHGAVDPPPADRVDGEGGGAAAARAKSLASASATPLRASSAKIQQRMLHSFANLAPHSCQL